MKILHAGIFKDHVLGGDIVFNEGFRENKCYVDNFDYREMVKKMGHDECFRNLIEQSASYDLLFIGKGELFTPEILKKIRKNKVKVALWYGDIRPEPPSWLINLLPNVDFYFMTSGGKILQQYFELGKPKLAAYFFNPSNPKLAQQYSQELEKKYNILFTGSNIAFSSEFRSNIISYLVKRKDATFFGGADKIATRKKTVLERAINKFFKKEYRNWIRGEEYINTIKEAKIGIGVNVLDSLTKYVSDRLTHYMTFGTFFLQSYFPQAEQIFDLDKELACFSNLKDFQEKIEYYLENSDEREKVAQKGQRKILKEYNTENIVKMFLEIINEGSSNRFEWMEILK